MKKGIYPIALLETKDMTNEEWLEARDHGDGSVKWAIGGSDVSTVLGVNPWKTPMELYDKKKGIEPMIKKPENTSAFARGHRYEDYVAEDFVVAMQKKGHTCVLYNDTRLFQHGEILTDEDGFPVEDENGELVLKYPFALANLDRLVIVDGETCILECKTTSCHNFDRIKDWQEGRVPVYYEYQCRYYMAIMNIDACYICCKWGLDENDMAYVRIDRDLEIEDWMMEQVAEFVKHLENDEPVSPGECDPELSLSYYASKYGMSDAKADEIELGEEYRDIIEKILQTDKAISQLETKLENQKAARNKFVSELAPILGNTEKSRFCIDENTTAYIKYKSARTIAQLDEEKIKKELPAAFEECKEFSSSKFRKEYKKILNSYLLPKPETLDKKLEVKIHTKGV